MDARSSKVRKKGTNLGIGEDGVYVIVGHLAVSERWEHEELKCYSKLLVRIVSC